MKYMKLSAVLVGLFVSGVMFGATGHVKLSNLSSHDVKWGLWSKEGKNFDGKVLVAGGTQLEGNDAGGKLKNMHITMTYTNSAGKTVTKYVDYYFPQDLEGYWTVLIDADEKIYMSSTKKDDTDVEIQVPANTQWTEVTTQ